ncbi:MAG: thermonuclease family protein [Spirochaetes bacterium]|nr:thermonuclease family protein [Spirochaetota bacterium]
MTKKTALLAWRLLFICALASAQTVYITKTGGKYHVAGCRYLSKSSIAINLQDAFERGYGPCSVCRPPTVRQSDAASSAIVASPRSTAPKVGRLTGNVVAIHDGDTLTLLVGTVQHKIRLNGIDAPELRQPFSQRSRQFLADLCFGKLVTVRVVDVDKYGREVGDVDVDGVPVNAELVRAGLAWHYKQYSKDATLAALEVEARSGKRGLWADPNPIPPWEFR